MAALKVEEKSEVNRILQRYLEKNTLEATFEWCTEKVIIPEPSPCSSLLEAVRLLFSNSPKEQRPKHIMDFTHYMMRQSNPHCVQLLSDILESLVNTNIIQPKLVCEGLLSQLNNTNLLTWQRGLSLINKIIGMVDYKGCREIMKLILDKFDSLPQSIEEKQVPVLHAGRKLLSYILNRDSSLMPAYMAHDEIQLRYSGPDAKPHWALKDVIANLKGTMEVVAGLVSGKMLPYLVPVVGCTNTAGTAWKLDSAQSCFSLPGRLPYSQELLKPQSELVYKVLGQPQSKDMIIGMLSLGKTPHIHTVLEECMVRLLLEGLKATNEWSITDTACIQTWSHLTSQFLLMSLIQVINSNTILVQLKEKVYGLELLKGRGYLMWLILYYLSGSNIPKDGSLQTECDVIVTLINALYTEKEPLPLPEDQTTCDCVYKLSAAGVWLVLTKKMESASITVPDVPVAIQRHIEMGFPMMLATTFTAMIYLLLCHVAFSWDGIDCP